MPRKRHAWWIAAVAVVVVSCAVDGSQSGQHAQQGREAQSTHRPAGTQTHHSGAPAGPAASASRTTILRELEHVRVLTGRPFPGGYDRDCGPGDGCVFGTAWTDDTTAPDSHNGCDTRNDVLREQLRHPVVDPETHGCKVVAGTLDDPYTGRRFDFAVHHQMIQIDHLVPLAYAWDMGASRWPRARRERFANDTSTELLAVWGPANESKGDSGPGDWLPVNRSFRCTYLQRYLHAIEVYDLAITRADATSIRYSAQGC